MADASVAVRTPGFESLLRWIAERTGLVFPEHRVGSVRETLERAMSRHGHTDLGSYQAQLDRDSSAFDALVVELTIGETYFFREPGQFAFIAGTILPDLLRQRHGEHALRVWSAACSSGEEAYSLAILFHEEGVGERFRILATDVSQTALARGKAARYRAWSLRGAAASRAEPYLERRGEEYVLADPVRRRVGFEYLNLALDAYPSFANGTWAMDLILCRNVLIYFDGEVIRRVAERLYASLAEGGWLLTAASDPPLEGFAPFEKLVNGDGTFYRRTGEAGAVAEPPARPRANSARPLTGPKRVPAPSPDPLAAAREALARGEWQAAIEATRDRRFDPAAAALHVRALANLDLEAATRLAADVAARHPLAADVHFVHAVLLLELGRFDESSRAIRRVTYLDRSLAVAHFTLGSILERGGDAEGARRAYRVARDLSAARPATEILPLSDGEAAGRLVAAADAQLALLERTPGAVAS